MRSTLLKYRNRRLLKFGVERGEPNYPKAEEVMLLFRLEEAEKAEVIQQFMENLTKEGKRVSALVYAKDAAKKAPDGFQYFDESYFSFSGSMKNPELIEFCQRKPVFLFHIDYSSNEYINHVLASIQAQCKVGVLEENRKAYYDLMIELHKSDGYRKLVDEMYRYAKKIKDEA